MDEATYSNSLPVILYFQRLIVLRMYNSYLIADLVNAQCVLRRLRGRRKEEEPRHSFFHQVELVQSCFRKNENASRSCKLLKAFSDGSFDAER